jgi:hypothetical protein
MHGGDFKRAFHACPQVKFEKRFGHTSGVDMVQSHNAHLKYIYTVMAFPDVW